LKQSRGIVQQLSLFLGNLSTPYNDMSSIDVPESTLPLFLVLLSVNVLLTF